MCDLGITMDRRAYLSATVFTVVLSGCVGNGSSTDSVSNGGGGDGGAGEDGAVAGSGEIDRTETPRTIPDPVRNERLRPSSGQNRDTEAIEIAVHEWVNGVREEHDVPLFPWNDDMNESPRAHSRDMAHKGYFDKTAPNGQTFRPTGCDEWEELLFRMRVRDPSPDTVAIEAVAAWMSSEDHRTKLTDGNFLRHGLGAAISSDGWLYLSHSLCR